MPKVLRLLKRVYGIKQAPKTFSDRLKAGFLERNIVQSQVDKCLFVKGDMICLVYVNDKIMRRPSLNEINNEIKGLRMKGEDQVHSFQLNGEGQVRDLLAIRIEK